MLKKIIYILFIIFLNINICYASTLKSSATPYYAKIKDSRNNTEVVVQIKKIEDENGDAVFNLNYDFYDTNGDFLKSNSFDRSVCSKNNFDFNSFMTRVYYGYNVSPSPLKYYLTQVIVWNMSDYVKAWTSDEDGNIITTYQNIQNDITSQAAFHYLSSSFFNQTYNRNVFDEDKWTYSSNAIILDNPQTDAFSFQNNNNDLSIKALKPGYYELVFEKIYDHDIHCFRTGNNIYWQSLKGPEDLVKNITYNVSGYKFQIKENLLGINSRFGDAKINNSQYEIYYNNDLENTISSTQEIYLKHDSQYLVKDISETIGYNHVDDYIFAMANEDYILEINREVISKNVSLDIKDNNKYYIYLKSSNELYEEINSNIDLITLPYGIYYISDQKKYYKELNVLDSVDEVLVIDNTPQDIIENKSDDYPEEVIEIKELIPNIEEVVNEEDEEIIVVNPKTGDKINYYLIIFLISLIGLTSILILKYINNR